MKLLPYKLVILSIRIVISHGCLNIRKSVTCLYSDPSFPNPWKSWIPFLTILLNSWTCFFILWLDVIPLLILNFINREDPRSSTFLSSMTLSTQQLESILLLFLLKSICWYLIVGFPLAFSCTSKDDDLPDSFLYTLSYGFTLTSPSWSDSNCLSL